MNRIRDFFSGLNFPRPPTFNRNPPCEIMVEFFTCGHTVTTRRCRNDARIWRDDSWHDPVSACDSSCRTRLLPTIIHMRLSCTWCRLHPWVPSTSSVRSDPGVDELDPAEVRRRQNFYLSQWRARLTDSQRDQFYQRQGKRAQWETYKRLQHQLLDTQGWDWRDRTYFLGEGNDDRLFVPIDRSTIPDDEDGQCQICKESLRQDGDPVVLPCHPTHRFHVDCLDQWLQINATCPVCRAGYQFFTFQEWEALHDNRFFASFFLSARIVPRGIARQDQGDNPEGVPPNLDEWVEPEIAAEWNDGF